MSLRLFHFSEDPGIEVFEPRPVRTASPRKPGMEWLNGPLVWAIDEPHQFMYLFPRDCPRILLWPTQRTSGEDRARWLGSGAQRLAVIERAWAMRLEAAVIHRYELDPAPFENLHDAGMWVSRETVGLRRRHTIERLPDVLRRQGARLKVVDSLEPFLEAANSSLHFSGIRLRNMSGGRGERAARAGAGDEAPSCTRPGVEG